MQRRRRAAERGSARAWRFGRLADRFRHFARLAVAEADAAPLVADDDERGDRQRRPPFTTLATRLMWTRRSTNANPFTVAFATANDDRPHALVTAIFFFRHLRGNTRPGVRSFRSFCSPADVETPKSELEVAFARHFPPDRRGRDTCSRRDRTRRVLTLGDSALGDELADRLWRRPTVAPVFRPRVSFSMVERRRRSSRPCRHR